MRPARACASGLAVAGAQNNDLLLGRTAPNDFAEQSDVMSIARADRHRRIRTSGLSREGECDVLAGGDPEVAEAHAFVSGFDGAAVRANDLVQAGWLIIATQHPQPALETAVTMYTDHEALA